MNPSLHYVGAGQIAPDGDHRRCEDLWQGIKNEHTPVYGPDSAYNFAACNAHGVTMTGRGWSRDSAANGQQGGVDYNPGSRALVALIGTGDTPTPQLEAACAAFANEAFARGYPRPLKAHSELVATNCPGDDLRAFIDRFNAGTIPPSPEDDDVPTYIAKISDPATGIWVTDGVWRRHVNPDEWAFAQFVRPGLQPLPLTDQWWDSIPQAK